MRIVLLITGGILLALCLAGCSGAGAPASQVSGAGVQSLATDQLSAVALVRDWSRLLYTQQESPPVFHWKIFPDNSSHIWGTESDGGVFTFFQQVGGQGSGSLQWPSGESCHYYWSAPVFTASTDTQVSHINFGDGARFDFSMVLAFTAAGYPQTWEGSAQLADGRTARFNLTRLQPGPGVPGQDLLVIRLPDGSVLRLKIPTQSTQSSSFWPIYASGADGSFTTGSHRLTFHLSGSGSQWDNWRFTTSAGARGSFSLNADFSGAGTISQGSALSGSLQWTPDTSGSLSLLGSATAAVSPSAVARAFEINRWISHVAQLGPCPEY